MSWLLDTTVLIDLQRGFAPALAWLARQSAVSLHISAVSVFELSEGAETAEHRKQIHKMLDAMVVENVDAAIALKGGQYLRDYAKRAGLDEFDAIIAATAQVRGLKVATANIKHFPMLKGLKSPY